MHNKTCKGYLNIERQNFPFLKKEEKIYIDQETCGVDGENCLEIKFCPVCGEFL